MRPKRIVLLVDSDEDRQAQTRYILRTAGFEVISRGNADSARKAKQRFDIIVGYWPVRWGILDSLAHKVHVRFILVCPKATGEPAGMFADSVLAGQNACPTILIERVKFGCARKRGPRPAERKENKVA